MITKLLPYLIFLSTFVFNSGHAQSADVFSATQRNGDGRLCLATIKEQVSIREAGSETLILQLFSDKGLKVVKEKTESDEAGFTHILYRIEKNGIVFANKKIRAHFKNGVLRTLNGDLELGATRADNGFLIGENTALQAALDKIDAEVYKWQNKEEELFMQQTLEDPAFGYFPAGEKVWFEKNGTLYPAWKFNIYAEKPLYRANVFVNAVNGEVLDEQSLICHADVPGTAITKYSGTQTLTVDQNGSQYRLRQSQRGLGIETYNMGGGTSYAASGDFTNAAASWTNTGFDQAATDAHWGAEKTYDYYLSQHNRNSIDNAGFKMRSFVHYNTGYSNAFWDGQRMTYGDGNGSSTDIFTALDVCGHEITHGLTDFSSNLIYSYQSGALNESFSDIFGTTIERYARPGNWNWKTGEDLTVNGNGLRDMSNPKGAPYYDPDTYKGTFWYAGANDNGGVHTNSGVPNYWFYLLSMGGTGINDISDAYAVQGIGVDAAARIAFRALTLYFTPTTDFAAARADCIQAASDLYGDCSNEMIQTANAWYAVGVGKQVSATTVNPDFSAQVVSFCSFPATVNFINTTPYAQSYSWNFGDGGASSAQQPVHTYTAPGNYNVQLTATGCGNTDNTTKSSFVSVNTPAAPTVTDISVCKGETAILLAQTDGYARWYSNSQQPVGNYLYAGNSIAINNLSNDASYYVTNTYTFAAATGGLISPTGGGYNSNESHYLEFDVLQPSVLQSVVVHVQTSGVRVVELRSSSKTVLQSKAFNLTPGYHAITLDFPLVPGTGYELGLPNGGTANLYRTNSGVSFPYSVGNCVTITGSSAGAGYYYWFYSWKVAQKECVSPGATVKAAVLPVPDVSLSVPQQVCMDDLVNIDVSPQGGQLSGSGVQASAFSASSLGPGEYTVHYQVTGTNGCTGAASSVVTVEECTGLTESSVAQLDVFPNPASGIVHLTGLRPGSVVRLLDNSGRLLFEANSDDDKLQLDVSEYAKGIYLLTVTSYQAETSAFRLIRE